MSAGQFDTSCHRYVTGGPTGDTELINGNIAYYYYLKTDNYRAGTYQDSDSGIVLLKEDLEDKQIYMLSYYPGIRVSGDHPVADFSDYSREIYFNYLHPELTEYSEGTISIAEIPTAKSSVMIPGKGPKFYKAIGIGGPHGPFGPYANIEGVVDTS